MKRWIVSALLAASSALYVSPAAARGLEIAFITTLSTSAGYIGADERDGFLLAVRQGGGKLGGVPVNLRIEDDELKPARAKQAASRLLKDGVRLFTGVNFSNVMLAVAPTVLDAGAFMVSLNAGPSRFAGAGCHPNYFAVAFQNDSYSDTVALAANTLGFERVVIMAPDYEAGRDAVSGFKQSYRGEVLDEIVTRLDQTNFMAELARVRALDPDALFQFHPGNAGIELAKQYVGSGLAHEFPMVTPVYSMDRHMLEATGQAGNGYYVTALWSADLPNVANRHFVEDFVASYGRMPTDYAAQAYDAARLIGSALQAVDGDIEGKADAFRAAMRKADFPSVRGKFRFARNQHPIQDWYLLRIEPGKDGKMRYRMIKTVAIDHSDRHAADCPMHAPRSRERENAASLTVTSS